MRGSTPVTLIGSFDELPSERIVPKACGTTTDFPVFAARGEIGALRLSFSRGIEKYRDNS